MTRVCFAASRFQGTNASPIFQSVGPSLQAEPQCHRQGGRPPVPQWTTRPMGGADAGGERSTCGDRVSRPRKETCGKSRWSASLQAHRLQHAGRNSTSDARSRRSAPQSLRCSHTWPIYFAIVPERHSKAINSTRVSMAARARDGSTAGSCYGTASVSPLQRIVCRFA